MVDSPAFESTETVPSPLEAPSVPDTWFQAHTRANGFIPQSDMAINIYLLDAMLNDPPRSWQSLPRLELSSQQTEVLKTVKAKKHEKYGIKSNPEIFDPVTRNVILDEDKMNAGLWSQSRDTAMYSLLTLVKILEADDSMTAEQVLVFLDDPVNTQVLERFKKIIGVMRAEFETPETRRMAREYRKTLVAVNENKLSSYGGETNRIITSNAK